jgi:MFS family permease
VCTAWGRFIALELTDNFYVLMGFQVVGALCYPFFQNSFAKISAIWFGEKERATATTIGAISYGGGSLVGLVLGPMFVLDTDREPGNWERGKEHTKMYMLVVACIVTVLCLPTIFIFRQAPKHYPSIAAQQDAEKIEARNSGEEEEGSFWPEFRALMGNANFLLICVSFSMQTSCQAVFSTVIDEMLKPYDYSSTATSLVAVCFAGGGLISCVIASAWVDRTKKFNLLMRTCAVFSLAMTGLMYLTLPSENVWLLAGNALLVGLAMFPVINISYTYAVELTYPVSEPMSNGTMSFTQMVVTTCMSVAVTRFIKIWGAESALATFLVMEGLSLLALLFIKQDLRRAKAEREETGVKHSLVEGVPLE